MKVCLSDNACWNMETGNTYLYGCTDETYKHYTCPKKCGFNSELSNWVGMYRYTDLPWCVLIVTAPPLTR